MKILQFNQAWFRSELQSLGHEVVVVGFQRPDYDLSIEKLGTSLEEIISLLPSNFTPDCIVVHDDSGTPWFTGLESTNLPSVFLSVDTHHHYAWHQTYSRCFDHLLVAQKKFLGAEHSLHPFIEWFPLWAQSVPPEADTRDIDIAFRGTMDPGLHPYRAQWFKALSEFVSCDVGSGQWETCYPRAKIVVNQNVSDDLNFRNFEAMVSGALLFSPQFDNGLLDLFHAGEELITYDHAIEIEKLSQQLNYYLANEPVRKRIAEAGKAKVLSSHTAMSRAKRLLELLSSLQKREIPERYVCSLRSLYVTLILLYRNGDRARLKEVAKSMNTLVGQVMQRQELSRGDSDDQRDSFLCLWFLYEGELYEECVSRAESLRQYDPTNGALYGIYEIASHTKLNNEVQAKALAEILSSQPNDFYLSVPEMLSVARKTLEETFAA